MSKANAWETGLLELAFKNSNFATLGDATGLRGSTVAGSLYFALHTADPGETGSQTTSEATYTGYARAAVARSAVGFTVTGNSVSPASAVAFPVGSAGSGTVTNFSVGTESSGAGIILYKGAVAPNIVTGSGITPSLANTSAITED